MADLFDGYPTGAAWDEMFDRSGQVRTSYSHVHQALVQMSATELKGRAERLARSYVNQGVTFDFAGEERPFPLDVAPRVLDGAEWDRVSPGVAQRVRALEAFLADATHVRAQLRLHGLVAQARLLVGTDALDLGLDVCHV